MICTIRRNQPRKVWELVWHTKGDCFERVVNVQRAKSWVQLLHDGKQMDWKEEESSC